MLNLPIIMMTNLTASCVTAPYKCTTLSHVYAKEIITYLGK